MKHVTIVIYGRYPIADESDDDRSQIRSFILTARADNNIREKAERVADKLARKYSCYVQVWDID